ncbi:MAG: phospho-sugar mutase, partial [Bacilli bacterium]
MKNDYLKNYQRWLDDQELEPTLKEELLNLKEDKIEDCFYQYIDFGTAGMRGLLGCGTNRMNIYTIRRASLGFGEYLLNNKENAQEKGVCIAYDSRFMSFEFACEAAKVLASLGIKVRLYQHLRSTPQLSFAIRKTKACGGIVITASHNPKEYNGYKIYDENGCQCIPVEADKVVSYINEVANELVIIVESFDYYFNEGLITYLDDQIDEAYNDAIIKTSFNQVVKDKVRLVYTALHGTGYQPIHKAFQSLGYQHIYYVEDQCKPDPTFKSVPYPNPEDPSVFNEALKIGQRVKADALLATDPDADRLGIALLNSENKYVFLNGNATGALMTYY